MNHHGLTRLNALRLTRNQQVSAFFRGVDDVIGGNRIDGDRHRVEVEFNRGVRCNRVAPAVLRAGVNIQLTGVPVLQIRRRHTDLPVAIVVDNGLISNIVDGDVNERSGRQMGAGTCDHQILLLFDGVNDVIARQRADTQPRQRGVDVDIAIVGTGVAVAVSHRRGEGQITVAERQKIA